MKLRFHWLITLAGNSLVLFLIQLVNDILAPRTLHIQVDALFVLFPTLIFPFVPGLLCVMTTGLVADATHTLHFGTSLILFSVAYTFIYWMRIQFQGYSSRFTPWLSQIINAVLFLAISLILAANHLTSLLYWVSALINLTLSQGVLFILQPWFLSLQHSLLKVSKYNFSDSQAHPS